MIGFLLQKPPLPRLFSRSDALTRQAFKGYLLYQIYKAFSFTN
jgi:hypothetical protein